MSDQIRATGDWFERPVLDEIAHRVTGGVLVDVGAMIGNHSVYMALYVAHTEIHAFEPLPANFDRLHRNVLAFPSIKVHRVALSDHGHVVRMSAELDNYGHARITADGAHHVRAIPLDAYQLVDVSLIKIDVEGHEPQVLAGAADTIARCHPLLVLEDWTGKLKPPVGYQLAAEWEEAHQTFMFEWAA